MCLNNLEGEVSLRMFFNEVHMIVVDLFLMYRGYKMAVRCAAPTLLQDGYIHDH